METIKRAAIGLAIGLVRLYQVGIRPWLPSVCRFTPSCSAYAIEAFQQRGFWLGGWLTMKRLGRCHPGCHGGYDPVPRSPASK